MEPEREAHDFSLLQRERRCVSLVDAAVKLAHYLKNELLALAGALFNGVERETVNLPAVQHQLVLSLPLIIEAASCHILSMRAEVVHFPVDQMGMPNIGMIEII